MEILPGMSFLGFRLSCLASGWFPKIQEKSPKFKFFKIVFYKNNFQHKSYNENTNCFTEHGFHMYKQFKIKFRCIKIKHKNFMNV